PARAARLNGGWPVVSARLDDSPFRIGCRRRATAGIFCPAHTSSRRRFPRNVGAPFLAPLSPDLHCTHRTGDDTHCDGCGRIDYRRWSFPVCGRPTAVLAATAPRASRLLHRLPRTAGDGSLGRESVLVGSTRPACPSRMAADHLVA